MCAGKQASNPDRYSAAEAFIANGGWVSLLALADAVWVLSSVYELGAGDQARGIQMLLDHRPGKVEEIDEDLKRILDKHIEAADKEPERISREDLLRNGIRKLKHHMPR